MWYSDGPPIVEVKYKSGSNEVIWEFPGGYPPSFDFFGGLLAFYGTTKMLSIVCSGRLEVTYALHLVLGLGLQLIAETPLSQCLK